MAKNRTPDEVSNMIAHLEAQEYSYVNSIILDVLYEDMSADDVYNKYPDDDEDWEERLFALDAVRWLEGEISDEELLDE